MKKILFVLFLFAGTTLYGAVRDVENAAAIAAEYFNTTTAQSGIRRAPAAKEEMRLAHTAKKKNSKDAAFYVFNRKSNGFIIVSADDRTEDVLCYSDEGSFNPETINPAFAWWLSRYEEQISAVNDEMAYTQAEKAAARKAVQTTAISPLLGNIAWDQSTPYNNLCPKDPTDNTRSLTGCVATAAAQVMKYWRYPAQGTGTKSYTCEFADKSTKILTADYGSTTYDWDNMLDTYGSNYTTAQGTAVATLMYHCGVAAEMAYGGDEAGGSGAWTDVLAVGIAEHMGYEYTYFITQYSEINYGTAAVPSDKAKYSVTTSSFVTYFNQDLEAGRPIVMGGEDGSSGHEFVCDGRDANGNFHINWGWSGESNCYCALTSLKPTGTTYKFSSKIDALVGLKPAVIDTVHVTGVSVNPTTATLKINEKATLAATIVPTNATIKTVTWSSSDSKIVSVNNGVITGVKAGNATITATSVDGGFKGTCAVTVSTDTVKHVDCEAYSYTFTASCKAGEKTLGDADWTVSIQNETYTHFDKTKGAQFGSGKAPAQLVTLVTEDTEDCTISNITVNASIAKDGDAQLAVYIGGTQVGNTTSLTTTATDYTFTNNKDLQGAVKVELSNTAKAIYLLSIAWNNGGGGGGTTDTAAISIGEFLTKKDTKTVYKLTGIVEKIEKTDYGNFTLTDSTGSIYIYGLKNGSTAKNVMTLLNITEKDTLTLTGVYSEYNSKAQIKNASYVSHKKYQGQIKDISNTPETAYTTSEAKDLIDDGEGLSTKVYVKGVVSEIDTINIVSGNATFYMTDGTTPLYVFRIKGLNDQAITDENIIQKGCSVIVYGQLALFQSTTYEIKNGYFNAIDCTKTGLVEQQDNRTGNTKQIINGQLQLNINGKIYNALGVLILNE